jgi:hypothetical protein
MAQTENLKMMKPTSMEKMQEMVCLVSLQVKSADAQ